MMLTENKNTLNTLSRDLNWEGRQVGIIRKCNYLEANCASKAAFVYFRALGLLWWALISTWLLLHQIMHSHFARHRGDDFFLLLLLFKQHYITSTMVFAQGVKCPLFHAESLDRVCEQCTAFVAYFSMWAHISHWKYEVFRSLQFIRHHKCDIQTKETETKLQTTH